MALVHKFEFDLSFDQNPLHAMGLAGFGDDAPLAPTYSDEEMEAARKLAWVEGRRVGEDQARLGLERRLSDAIDQLAHNFENFVSEQQRTIADAERRAAEIALSLLQKLFPALLERSGIGEMEQMLTQVLSQSIEQHRIVVHCAEDLHTEITALTSDVAKRAGFAGNLVVIADAACDQHDCRIEWAEGGVERAPRRMFERIELAILKGMNDLDRRIGRAGDLLEEIPSPAFSEIAAPALEPELEPSFS